MKVNFVFAMKNRENPRGVPQLVEYSGLEATTNNRHILCFIPDFGKGGDLRAVLTWEDRPHFVGDYKSPFMARVWSSNTSAAQLRRKLAAFLADQYRREEENHRRERERYSVLASAMAKEAGK